MNFFHQACFPGWLVIGICSVKTINHRTMFTELMLKTVTDLREANVEPVASCLMGDSGFTTMPMCKQQEKSGWPFSLTSSIYCYSYMPMKSRWTTNFSGVKTKQSWTGFQRLWPQDAICKKDANRHDGLWHDEVWEESRLLHFLTF